MQTSNAPRNRLRGGVMALAALIAFGALPLAQADDIQDAQKLLKAGQPQQALERVNRALAANARDPQARFLKGLIFTEQGKQAEAIDIFTKLTQDYPNLPEPYNNLAVIYASQGQYDKARAALEQSIRTHPSYATAYENLGDVYAKLASQAYGKALQLDSSNTGAQNKLSLVRELVGGPTKVAAVKEPAKPAAVPEKPGAGASARKNQANEALRPLPARRARRDRRRRQSVAGGQAFGGFPVDRGQPPRRGARAHRCAAEGASQLPPRAPRARRSPA